MEADVFTDVFTVPCSLAGDFGFDPLNLGADPTALKWYIAPELSATTSSPRRAGGGQLWSLHAQVFMEPRGGGGTPVILG